MKTKFYTYLSVFLILCFLSFFIAIQPTLQLHREISDLKQFRVNKTEVHQDIQKYKSAIRIIQKNLSVGYNSSFSNYLNKTAKGLQLVSVEDLNSQDKILSRREYEGSYQQIIEQLELLERPILSCLIHKEKDIGPLIRLIIYQESPFPKP